MFWISGVLVGVTVWSLGFLVYWSPGLQLLQSSEGLSSGIPAFLSSPGFRILRSFHLIVFWTFGLPVYSFCLVFWFLSQILCFRVLLFFFPNRIPKSDRAIWSTPVGRYFVFVYPCRRFFTFHFIPVPIVANLEHACNRQASNYRLVTSAPGAVFWASSGLKPRTVQCCAVAMGGRWWSNRTSFASQVGVHF